MNRAMAATTTMKHQSALQSAEAGMSSFVLPRPAPKEFALQEQPSSSGRPACRLPKHTIALVFGLGGSRRCGDGYFVSDRVPPIQ